MINSPRVGKTIISKTFYHQIWEGESKTQVPTASSSVRVAGEVERQKTFLEEKRMWLDFFLDRTKKNSTIWDSLVECGWEGLVQPLEQSKGPTTIIESKGWASLKSPFNLFLTLHFFLEEL